MQGVRLQAQVLSPKQDGPGEGLPELTAGQHEYQPPYDRDRMNNPLPQRREPYVDARVEAKECSVLTLLSASGPGEDASPWSGTDDTWSVITVDGTARVSLASASLVVAWEGMDQQWEVPLT